MIIALASKQIGQFFTRFQLPLITGFLFTGIITGPFGLNLITHDALENLRIIDEISLAFIAFAAGSELFLQELKSLLKSIAWITVGLALFFVRLTGIFMGSFTGRATAGKLMVRNRIWWLAFITQAGVAIGLSKEVAVGFSPWGSAFATLIISLVVLNEVIGPIFFQWAVNHVGEAHTRTGPQEFDGVRDALIFGFEVRAPWLDGVALRDLHLPDDVLILSVQRDGHVLISHGYTRLKIGDQVTAVGSEECLAEVMLKLDE